MSAAGFNSPSAGLKTIEEQIGLPPRPKKPLTPYFRYMRDTRSEISAQNPMASTREVVRVISNKWKTVDPSLKQRLQEEFKKDLEIYVETRAKYDAEITDEQRSEIKKLKQEKVDARERRIMRRRIRDLGRPKKPASAFFRYVSEQRAAMPTNLPAQNYREWHKKCTASWAAMSDKEKEKFLTDARNEIEQYKKDMLVWEEKMLRSGNIDVLRHRNTISPSESKDTEL